MPRRKDGFPVAHGWQAQSPGRRGEPSELHEALNSSSDQLAHPGHSRLSPILTDAGDPAGRRLALIARRRHLASRMQLSRRRTRASVCRCCPITSVKTSLHTTTRASGRGSTCSDRPDGHVLAELAGDGRAFVAVGTGGCSAVLVSSSVRGAGPGGQRRPSAYCAGGSCRRPGGKRPDAWLPRTGSRPWRPPRRTSSCWPLDSFRRLSGHLRRN